MNHNLNDSGSHLIDVNDMINKIDAGDVKEHINHSVFIIWQHTSANKSTTADVHADAHVDAQDNGQLSTKSQINYHKQCASQSSNTKTGTIHCVTSS